MLKDTNEDHDPTRFKNVMGVLVRAIAQINTITFVRAFAQMRAQTLYTPLQNDVFVGALEHTNKVVFTCANARTNTHQLCDTISSSVTAGECNSSRQPMVCTTITW
jgi:hypothetical protein